MNTAVLFLVFNRPETTKLVFDSIRKAAPKRLYISADGPRTNSQNDFFLCSQVREIVGNVDWDCHVQTNFRDENLGCKVAVSSAIDWFFENESEGIILEDDVLPLDSFYKFCAEMLEKYRNNDKISLVTGSNLISKHCSGDESYFFSNYPNIWGWATWKRFWIHYDVDMKSWSSWKKSKEFNELSMGYPYFKFYWTDQLDAVHNNKINTWDFQLFLANWQIQNYCIVPMSNLTSNLGFDDSATHTSGAIPSCVLESTPINLVFPLNHPKNVSVNYSLDYLINHNVFKIKLRTVLMWKLRRVYFVGEFLSKVRKSIRKLLN